MSRAGRSLLVSLSLCPACTEETSYALRSVAFCTRTGQLRQDSRKLLSLAYIGNRGDQMRSPCQGFLSRLHVLLEVFWNSEKRQIGHSWLVSSPERRSLSLPKNIPREKPQTDAPAGFRNLHTDVRKSSTFGCTALEHGLSISTFLTKVC